MALQEKIRVLQFICPTGLHGAERWILALARELDPAVIDCQLAVTHEFEGQNLEIADLFRDLGLKTHLVPMTGRFDLRAVSRLFSVIRDEKIDILHSHGYKSDILGLMAARYAGIKAISTPHGFETAIDLKLRLFIGLGCFSMKFFDAVAPLSDELAEDMRRLKIPESRICLIRNGVDIQELEDEKTKNDPPLFADREEKRIGYIGQLIGRKNLPDMIRAFEKLSQRHPDVRLVFVGDGPMREELEAQAQSLDCSDQIEFLGYRRDRLRILRELDILAMTSALEGVPRCMMEAMGLNVSIAAFNIPGVDKLIIHGKTGLMAPFGDTDALCECWERILFSPEDAERMAKNAYDHLRTNFSAHRMANEYTQLFRQIIS